LLLTKTKKKKIQEQIVLASKKRIKYITNLLVHSTSWQTPSIPSVNEGQTFSRQLLPSDKGIHSSVENKEQRPYLFGVRDRQERALQVRVSLLARVLCGHISWHVNFEPLVNK
jgi:hypothetical protein